MSLDITLGKLAIFIFAVVFGLAMIPVMEGFLADLEVENERTIAEMRLVPLMFVVMILSWLMPFGFKELRIKL